MLADKVNLVYLQEISRNSLIVADLHHSVFPTHSQVQEKSETQYLQVYCTKKVQNYDARDWLFFISYMMDTW